MTKPFNSTCKCIIKSRNIQMCMLKCTETMQTFPCGIPQCPCIFKTFCTSQTHMHQNLTKPKPARPHECVNVNCQVKECTFKS